MSRAAEQTATHRTARVCNETTRVRIEQLRAYDWPTARIANALALPLDVVVEVWRRQDQTAGVADHAADAASKPGPKPGSRRKRTAAA